MLIKRLKIMKGKFIKADEEKNKGEIQTLNETIRKIKKLEEKIEFIEKEKQKTLFDAIDKY